MKSTKQIHNLLKNLIWEMVEQVLKVEVEPLRKSELDRPFDDRIIDEQRYLSHLGDLMMMEEEEHGKLVEYLWILIWILSRLFVS